VTGAHRATLVCLECGYDVTATLDAGLDVCPECGADLSPPAILRRERDLRLKNVRPLEIVGGVLSVPCTGGVLVTISNDGWRALLWYTPVIICLAAATRSRVRTYTEYRPSLGDEPRRARRTIEALVQAALRTAMISAILLLALGALLLLL